MDRVEAMKFMVHHQRSMVIVNGTGKLIGIAFEIETVNITVNLIVNMNVNPMEHEDGIRVTTMRTQRGDIMKRNVVGEDENGNGIRDDPDIVIQRVIQILMIRIIQIRIRRHRMKRKEKKHLLNENGFVKRGNGRGRDNIDWIRRRAARIRLHDSGKGIFQRRSHWDNFEGKRARKVCMIIDCLIRTADSIQGLGQMIRTICMIHSYLRVLRGECTDRIRWTMKCMGWRVMIY